MEPQKEVPFAEVQQEQEDLAAVDTGLNETIGAIRDARETIVGRLGLTRDGGLSPGDTLGILQAGRRQVLQRLAHRRDPHRGAPEDDARCLRSRALRELTQEFTEQLQALVDDAATSTVEAGMVESIICSAVKSYLAAVRRTLVPSQSESQGEGGDKHE